MHDFYLVWQVLEGMGGDALTEEIQVTQLKTRNEECSHWSKNQIVFVWVITLVIGQHPIRAYVKMGIRYNTNHFCFVFCFLFLFFLIF